MSRLAVVLCNLGGPDGPEAVRPFLFNLFNDPAIISLPAPLRWLVARLVSRLRAPVARQIYAELGGSSPLYANTRAQARALEAALKARGLAQEVRCFIAMRYWHPFAAETVAEIRAFGPERVVLLPLYPQFSTTTTGSSLEDWQRAARRGGLEVPTTAVCCYPEQAGFIEELTRRAAAGLEEARRVGPPRLLFSAHGLPEKIVARGDPYPWQVERTAAAVAARLRTLGQGDEGLDWLVCYQSRVGPLAWIGPSTEAEIARGGRDRVPLVVVPIAFVSEHSETLVELDIEYRRRAEAEGVPAYVRVATVSTGAAFVNGLADLVADAIDAGAAIHAGGGARICPQDCGRCALAGG